VPDDVCKTNGRSLILKTSVAISVVLTVHASPEKQADRVEAIAGLPESTYGKRPGQSSLTESGLAEHENDKFHVIITFVLTGLICWFKLEAMTFSTK
jgi:hypothetical protein